MKDITYPRRKLALSIEVIEKQKGKTGVAVNIVEDNPTLNDIALFIYKLKRLEQEYIDMQFDHDDNYSIEHIDDGEDDNEED